jgi:site-specific DNA recombinase
VSQHGSLRRRRRGKKPPLDKGWHDLEPDLVQNEADGIARVSKPDQSPLPAPDETTARIRSAERRRRFKANSALEDDLDAEELSKTGRGRRRREADDDVFDGEDTLNSSDPDVNPASIGTCLTSDQLTGFDEVDSLTMRPNPELVKPKATKKKPRRVAIYARFSTNSQKQRSILHQVQICVEYYKEHLFAKTHKLFADKGRSGAHMDRAGIQALIAAIRAGEVDVVVFFAFDRVSRELISGLRFFEIAAAHRVELHCARSGRKYTKEDAAREAMEAENDLRLRTERTMDGLDELVRSGGLPWGWNFGHKPTRERGFPKKHKLHSKTVKTIFLDIVKMPADEVARNLTDEGTVNPTGGTFWNASTILMIAQNSVYTGRIRYRRKKIVKNTTTYDPVTGAEIRPDTVYSVSQNPEYEWVKYRNEALRIVSDAEFIAAAKAIKSRRRWSGGTRGPRQELAVPLFGSPICDCGTPALADQRFYLFRKDDGNCSHRYQCSLQGRNKSCRWEIGRSVPGDVVEYAIFDAVAPHLTARLNGFGEAFKRWAETIATETDLRRADFDQQIVELKQRERALLSDIITRNISDEAIEAESDDINRQLDKLREARTALPSMSTDELDFDGRKARIQDGIELVRQRIPFVPATEKEVLLVEALRRCVTSIVLCRSGRPQGRIGLQITVQWARLFLTDEQLKFCEYSPETIESEFILPFQYTGRNIGSMEHMSQLAASGLHALTDHQWTLVQDKLPDLTRTDHNGDRPTQTRDVVHCLLFQLRMEMPISAIPPFFGERDLVLNAINRFISAGGIEALVAVFEEHDPQMLEGLDLVPGIRAE